VVPFLPRSVAIFCATLALSCKQEIVIFSPGRRASRAILVRVQEFVAVAGFESNILEYNQEQLRVKTLDGHISTVRSFPSKKQVRTRTPRAHTHARTRTHTHRGRGGGGGGGGRGRGLTDTSLISAASGIYKAWLIQ